MEQQRWAEYDKGVSEHWSYSLRKIVKIVGFVQKDSGESQSAPRGKTYTGTGTCSCDLSRSCLKWSTTGSISTFSALCFSERFYSQLVSAQNSMVYINHHAALYAIACIEQFVLSLSAMSLEIGSVWAERVGQGKVGWYIHPEGENSMVVCGFGCRNPSVGSLHKCFWKAVISPHRASMQCSSMIY